MRNKIGSLCMVFGALLLCAALSLYLSNQSEALQAEHSSAEIMPQLLEQLPTEPVAPALPTVPEQSTEMKEVNIDGIAYIGYLSIPSLELNLPVISDWDEAKLQIAACRYHGTLLDENLVIMAHNYPRLFGRLSELKEGDSLLFTDMDGNSSAYTVVGRDVLAAIAVEEMVAGDFDLTLFTCTYSGKDRITIYADFAKE